MCKPIVTLKSSVLRLEVDFVLQKEELSPTKIYKKEVYFRYEIWRTIRLGYLYIARLQTRLQTCLQTCLKTGLFDSSKTRLITMRSKPDYVEFVLL